MSNSKAYFIFLGGLALVGLLVYYGSAIFPIMNDYEYFVDEYDVIHDDNCPLREVPWFTFKHNKYDIIIGSDQTLCDECLLYDKEKLLMLHRLNLIDLSLRYHSSDYTQEYIEQQLKKYRPVNYDPEEEEEKLNNLIDSLIQNNNNP